MARRYYAGGGNRGARRSGAMLRLAQRAIEIDPQYAQAWSMIATAQQTLHQLDGGGDDGLAAAETALRLDPTQPEAHAVKGRHLSDRGQKAEAWAEFETALSLDPTSFEANMGAGRHRYRDGRFDE